VLLQSAVSFSACMCLFANAEEMSDEDSDYLHHPSDRVRLNHSMKYNGTWYNQLMQFLLQENHHEWMAPRDNGDNDAKFA
jgi:hypothetical protein